MTEDTALIEKREELKRQLVAGEYKPPMNVVLDGTGRLIQKLTQTRKPLPFWYSAVVIALVILLISLLTSILLGENYETRPQDILFKISTVGLILAVLIAGKTQGDVSFTTLRDHLLGAIESVADLADLQRWLAAFCSVKKFSFFSLAFAVLFTPYCLVFISTIRGFFLVSGRLS